MFDTFKYEKWSDTITDFWTWGGHNSAGTIILTVLGCILMVVALIGWVRLESKKLDRQAAMLRGGALAAGTPGSAPKE